jgi:mutator family transposase
VVVSKMELYELLRKAEGAEDVDFLREGVRTLAQALMEVEVTAQIGAEHGQRTPDRVTHRNGYRPRDWDTRVGRSSCRSPSCAPAATSPACWNHVGVPSGPWPRWSPSAMWRGCRPGGSTTSPGSWASTASPSRRCRGSAPSWTSWWLPDGTGPWTPAPTRLYGSTP